jgi:hypothetical protein
MACIYGVVFGAPEPAGWYAGDIHVHRSCGGSPTALSELKNAMETNQLSFMSVLADMGNGEVQDAKADLPKVTGIDDPVSTAGRTVRWDAEWHWDPDGVTFPITRLGGHVVLLRLTQALKDSTSEYTYPVFQYAHNKGGIAGFCHFQHFDAGTATVPPTSFNCCYAMEYPVEAALGSCDFISEDVSGGIITTNHYYKLLNCGFRVGLAAGTDRPCGQDQIGKLLTYGKASTASYNNWVQAIKDGKTVISRNGHNEFLNLVVNSTAGPGDQINITSARTISISVTWSAIQSLSGTIQVVINGTTVAAQNAFVTPSSPATLSADVVIDRSSWICARRMSGGEHQSHTAAVFVLVNNAPIRASATDAQYFITWCDNLLTRTANGGAWAKYFQNQLSAARARYQQAKNLYAQIKAEALQATRTLQSEQVNERENPAVFHYGYNLHGKLLYKTASASIPAMRNSGKAIMVSTKQSGRTVIIRVISR